MTHFSLTTAVPLVACFLLLLFFVARPALALALAGMPPHRPVGAAGTCDDCGGSICSKCGLCHYCNDIDLPCFHPHTVTLFCNATQQRGADAAKVTAIAPLSREESDPSACGSRPAVTLPAPGAERDGQLPVTRAPAITAPRSPTIEQRGRVVLVPWGDLYEAGPQMREQCGGAFVMPALGDEGSSDGGWCILHRGGLPDDDEGRAPCPAFLPSFPIAPADGAAIAVPVARYQDQQLQEVAIC
jgi:hypothetical protein